MLKVVDDVIGILSGPSQADGHRDGILVLSDLKQIRKRTKKYRINHDSLEAPVRLVM